MTGLDLLHTIQSIHSPGLDWFLGLVTNLHHETLYIVALPLLFWLYDKRFAVYLTSVFLLGYWANDLLKELFHTARPSPRDVRVLQTETAPGPAFPSGHAQNPLMFWGALAMQFRRRWFSWAAGIIIFLIGFSRLYLGVHWPLDVIGGWLIGALMLAGFARTRRFWTGEGMSLPFRLACAVAIPLGTLLIWRSAPWDAPKAVAGQSWIFSGAYLGIWVGTILEERCVGFNPRQGSVGFHLLKLVIGLPLLFAVKEGLKLALPATAAGDLVRYTAVGLTVTLVAPAIFSRLASAPPAARTTAH